MNDDDIQIDPAHVLAIVREENPLVFELARRRAVIERQQEIITQLHAATVNGDLTPEWLRTDGTSVA